MRRIYSAFVVPFAIAKLTFALQIFEVVTVSFLSFEMRSPLAVLILIVYVFGALTGVVCWPL